MSIKYDRVSVSPGVNVASRINQELQKIQEALERALDRLGDSPNAMESDLDMGLNDIINVNSIDIKKLLVDGKEPVFDGGIEEAPKDGKLYGRKDEEWYEVDNMEVNIDLSNIEDKLDSVVGLLEGSATVNGQILAAVEDIKTAVESKDYSDELAEIIDKLDQLATEQPPVDQGQQFYMNVVIKHFEGPMEDNGETGTIEYFFAEDAETGYVLGTNIPGEVLQVMNITSKETATNNVIYGYTSIGFTLPEGTILDTPTVSMPDLGVTDTDNVVVAYGEVDGVYVCEMTVHHLTDARFPENTPTRIEINTRS